MFLKILCVFSKVGGPNQKWTKINVQNCKKPKGLGKTLQ